jgi:hypothetical protein
VVEGERLLRLSSEEDEDDSLLRRLRLSFFNFFDFLGLDLDLDDRVDAARFSLASVPVLALADPFSSCVVTPSASLESGEIKGLVPTLVLATALTAAAADAAAAALVPGLVKPPSASQSSSSSGLSSSVGPSEGASVAVSSSAFLRRLPLSFFVSFGAMMSNRNRKGQLLILG